MLESLCLLVNVVPGDPDDVGEESLDQPVTADDRLSLIEPGLCEAQRLVLVAGHVAVVLEPADHLVHGRLRELHRARDVRSRDRELGLHQPVDRLEVLLLGGRRVLDCHRSQPTTAAESPKRSARAVPPDILVGPVRLGADIRALVTGCCAC